MKNYVAFYVQDQKTAESRLQVVDLQYSPPFLEVPKEIQPSIPVMIRKYVEKDTELDNWEIYHFTNWMFNFTRLSPLKQKRSKLDLNIWSFDTEQETIDFVNKLQRDRSTQGAQQVYCTTTLPLESVA